MPLSIVTVDAFTSEVFRGNPAAICVLSGPPSGPEGEEWMKKLAGEMNLSETAFLYPENDGYRLRWLTPAVEVDLCGHATLASAHVLWDDGHLAPDLPALFYTRSGLLTCVKKGDWIEMDFPAKLEQQAPAPPHLAEALGVTPKYVGRNQFDYLVEVADGDALLAIRPNHHLLRQIEVRGVIVTAKGKEYDFVSRFFAPGSGVDEDPVTGSAHTALGPFWGKRLGKTEMVAYQASARGGIVKVRLEGERVILSGRAVTILRGQLVDAAAASGVS